MVIVVVGVWIDLENRLGYRDVCAFVQVDETTFCRIPTLNSQVVITMLWKSARPQRFEVDIALIVC